MVVALTFPDNASFCKSLSPWSSMTAIYIICIVNMNNSDTVSSYCLTKQNSRNTCSAGKSCSSNGREYFRLPLPHFSQISARAGATNVFAKLFVVTVPYDSDGNLHSLSSQYIILPWVKLWGNQKNINGEHRTHDRSFATKLLHIQKPRIWLNGIHTFSTFLFTQMFPEACLDRIPQSPKIRARA